MSLFGHRLFRLFHKTEEQSHMAQQIQDLRHTLFSAIQEIEVLKRMLMQQGGWDEEVYRKLRIDRMLGDHSSAGASPWHNHSHYRYTLDEEDFLLEELRLSEREVAEYREQAETLGMQT